MILTKNIYIPNIETLLVVWDELEIAIEAWEFNNPEGFMDYDTFPHPDGGFILKTYVEFIQGDEEDLVESC